MRSYLVPPGGLLSNFLATQVVIQRSSSNIWNLALRDHYQLFLYSFSWIEVLVTSVAVWYYVMCITGLGAGVEAKGYTPKASCAGGMTASFFLWLNTMDWWSFRWDSLALGNCGIGGGYG